ncbi:lipopolysaccharide biosynthesis protein [Candidatus Altiarchaeota archaeon]
MDIAQKAVRGIGWVGLFVGTTKGVRFLTTIILARLLTPTDFGLVAIGLLAVNTIAIFRDLGVGQALIHKGGDVKKAANTTFILFPAVGAVLFIIAILAAPFISGFFNSPDSLPVIRFLSVSLLLVSLGLTPSVLLDKELEFKKQFLPEVGSMVAYGAIAISLAFTGYGVWSIVYGKILSLIVWLILIWYISPWRPKIEFEWEIAKGLLKYGHHILGATFIMFILTNVDNAFVGKMLGTTMLGFYSMAYTVSNVPALNVTNLIHRVMFPTYSKLQADEKTLNRIYLKTLKYSSAVAVPITMGIMVLAPDIISTVLGGKWWPALVPLQILCVAGVLRSIRGSTGVLINAIGRPDIGKKYLFFELITLSILIYPLSMYLGVAGTSLAVTIPVLAFALVGFNAVNNILHIGWGNFFRALKGPYASSFVMMTVIYVFQQALPFEGFIRLGLLFMVGGLTYVISVFMISREMYSEAWDILLKLKS